MCLVCRLRRLKTQHVACCSLFVVQCSLRPIGRPCFDPGFQQHSCPNKHHSLDPIRGRPLPSGAATGVNTLYYIMINLSLSLSLYVYIYIEYTSLSL